MAVLKARRWRWARAALVRRTAVGVSAGGGGEAEGLGGWLGDSAELRSAVGRVNGASDGAAGPEGVSSLTISRAYRGQTARA